VLYIYLSVSNSFLRDDANWVPQTHANVRVHRPSQDTIITDTPRLTGDAHYQHQTFVCTTRCRGAY
jgi:hypothetical protein